MRYQEGTAPEATAYAGTGEVLLGTAVYSLALGVGMLIFGLKKRQLWMSAWGGALALGSVATLAAVALGLT